MITKTLPKAWKAFTNNKRLLLLIILLDFVFLFLLAQLHLFFFVPSAQAALDAGEIINTEMSALPQSEIFQLDTILYNNPDFKFAYQRLLMNIGLLFLSMLGAFILFRGLLWYLALKSIHKKVPIKLVLIKFPLLTIFYSAITAVVLLAYILSTNVLSLTPNFTSLTSNLLVVLALLAIGYFANIGFALMPARQTFKKQFVFGIKHAKKILPSMAVNTLILFIALTLPFNFLQTKPIIGLGVILFVSIPSMAFTRINTIIAAWQK